MGGGWGLVWTSTGMLMGGLHRLLKSGTRSTPLLPTFTTSRSLTLGACSRRHERAYFCACKTIISGIISSHIISSKSTYLSQKRVNLAAQAAGTSETGHTQRAEFEARNLKLDRIGPKTMLLAGSGGLHKWGKPNRPSRTLFVGCNLLAHKMHSEVPEHAKIMETSDNDTVRNQRWATNSPGAQKGVGRNRSGEVLQCCHGRNALCSSPPVSCQCRQPLSHRWATDAVPIPRRQTVPSVPPPHHPKACRSLSSSATARANGTSKTASPVGMMFSSGTCRILCAPPFRWFPICPLISSAWAAPGAHLLVPSFLAPESAVSPAATTVSRRLASPASA